jgi:6-pyruvoyltetrahydropterin/6-carboxytetrahydropterin synthase
VSESTTPVIRITSRAHFSAAHRLHAEGRDDAWNRETFGKCNNPHGHGHTYELEVTVEGPIAPDTGWVMDFKDLKQIVSERIIKKCDCRNLNTDVPFLVGVVPTAENLAMRFWEQLDGAIPAARLVRVALHETERNKAIYTGPPR